MEDIKVNHFWTWFRKHSRSFPLYAERSIEKTKRFLEKILSRLGWPEEKMQLQISWNATDGSCTTLYFTCHGNVNVFGEIERFVARAPSISGWTFMALLPPLPIGLLQGFTLNDVSFDPFDLWFDPVMALDNTGKITVVTYMEMYVDNIELYEQVMCTAVFTVIGEKTYGVKVGDVVVKNILHLNTNKKASLVNLQQLPEYFKTSEVRSLVFRAKKSN